MKFYEKYIGKINRIINMREIVGVLIWIEEFELMYLSIYVMNSAECEY